SYVVLHESKRRPRLPGVPSLRPCKRVRVNVSVVNTIRTKRRESKLEAAGIENNQGRAARRNARASDSENCWTRKVVSCMSKFYGVGALYSHMNLAQDVR